MRALPGLVVTVLLCAACGGGDQGDEGPQAAPGDVKICVYTDGDSGQYWTTFKDGVDRAGADLGVGLDYQEADHDLEAQVNLVEAGIAVGCDALAVSAPDPAGMQHAADDVHAAGLPLVTVDTGVDAFRELHAFTHVGEDGAVVGREAGARLARLGATKVLCVEQEGESAILDRVCGALEESFPQVQELRLAEGVADLPASASEIEERLRADTTIDAVLSLDADLATGAVLPAVHGLGRPLTVGTVGASRSAVAAVQQGGLAFAMDPQPFTEGYLAVVLLYLAVTEGAEVGGGRPVYSGPGFVTR